VITSLEQQVQVLLLQVALALVDPVEPDAVLDIDEE
jgi:hypothetical protein